VSALVMSSGAINAIAGESFLIAFPLCLDLLIDDSQGR
jgi:hypothetical protein